MKILTKTTTVRLPNTVHDELIELSKLTNKHPSQIIRESVFQFVRYYRQNPQEISL